jgi:hypothetical protein
VLLMDFAYWLAFAIFQTTFALFAAARFGFDATRTASFFAAFAVMGAIVQGIFIRKIVQRFGDKPTLMLGLVCAAVGLIAATMTHTVTFFALSLVPLALGIGFGHPTMSSLISRAARAEEQGRVQGAASAVESLGRTIGARVGECVAAALRRGVPLHLGRRVSHHDAPVERRPSSGGAVTDQEKQKVEDLISRLELQVGQIFPRDGGNASLIAGMIQTLNGLRSALGVVRPH